MATEMTPRARARKYQSETRLGLVRRARRMNRILAETYPDAHCELNFTTPFELLVATVLSAQSTDKGVNLVTPALFAKFPTPEDLAAADPEDVETLIKATGFFRAKTKSIMGLSAALRDNFAGEVPRTLVEMVTLPGVGRKTANVVLGNARDPETGEPFGVPGLTVDTHFGRVVRRFGWTSEEDPVRVESAIAEIFPAKYWTDLSQRLVWHGRRRCHARRPACGVCPLARDCPAFGEGPTDPEAAAKLLRDRSFA